MLIHKTSENWDFGSLARILKIKSAFLTEIHRKMDGASKKKTPITDLMAYHLSQLSQELSAKGALPSPVAQDVEKVLRSV